MTLEILQQRLKGIAEKNHGEPFLLDELEVANFNELTMYLNNIRQSATEIAQLIISAKIKQPKKPQPVKYLTDFGGWSTKINNAFVWEHYRLAKSCCDANKIDESQIKAHNDGFVITKPATT